MAIQRQLRKGTTTEISTFVGANGEVVFDTTKKTLVLCDGVLAGGYPLPYLVSGKIPTNLIGDATTSVKGLVELATQAEVTAGTSSTLAVTPSSLPTATKAYLNASGNAPIYATRAWVCFNGVGTPSILGSGNVSSISDNGVGDYTINFTQNMPSANFAVNVDYKGTGLGNGHSVDIVSKTTSSVRITLNTDAANSYPSFDSTNISVTVVI